MTIKDEENIEIYTKSYEWSCKLTTEQKEDKYYWTSETKALLNRLKKTQGNMIAVIGFQGIGKTALRQALQGKLLFGESEGDEKVLTHSFKWMNNMEKTITNVLKEEVGGDFLSESDKTYFRELFDVLMIQCNAVSGGSIIETTNLMARRLHLADDNLPDDNSTLYRKYIENLICRKDTVESTKSLVHIIKRFEKALGKAKVQEIKFDILRDQLFESQTILIDFPDYNRENTSQINRDLSALSSFWENVVCRDSEGVYGQKVNLVIFFQKELFKGHFWFGKFDVYELKPFTAKQLLLCYKDNFKSYEPFTEKALYEVAMLSRGIFRRFKKYIRICIDSMKPDSITITLKDVKEWIRPTQMVADMELELMNVFPKEKENRVLTVKLLSLLREKGSMTQTEITEQLFDNAKMRASRVLGKLESWNYIKRKYDGQNKIVELDLSKEGE